MAKVEAERQRLNAVNWRDCSRADAPCQRQNGPGVHVTILGRCLRADFLSPALFQWERERKAHLGTTVQNSDALAWPSENEPVPSRISAGAM
jgi:hypothetical protein